MIKKDNRSEMLSKNLEESEAMMKEVFESGLKSGCDNLEDICNIPPEMFQECNMDNGFEKDVDITIIDVQEVNNKADVELSEIKEPELVKIEDVQENSDELELVTHIENLTSDKETNDSHDIADTASVASEITFNNDEDKMLSKKYKAMNV